MSEYVIPSDSRRKGHPRILTQKHANVRYILQRCVRSWEVISIADVTNRKRTKWRSL